MIWYGIIGVTAIFCIMVVQLVEHHDVCVGAACMVVVVVVVGGCPGSWGSMVVAGY